MTSKGSGHQPPLGSFDKYRVLGSTSGRRTTVWMGRASETCISSEFVSLMCSKVRETLREMSGLRLGKVQSPGICVKRNNGALPPNPSVSYRHTRSPTHTHSRQPKDLCITMKTTNTTLPSRARLRVPSEIQHYGLFPADPFPLKNPSLCQAFCVLNGKQKCRARRFPRTLTKVHRIS